MSAGRANLPSVGPTDRRDYERRRARILELLRANDSDWADWQWQARGVSSPEVLDRILNLTDRERASLSGPSRTVKATPHFLALSEPGEPSCPIRRQAIPQSEDAGDDAEPSSQRIRQKSPTPILEQLSPQQARLTITTSCPAFCRYCFHPFGPTGEGLGPSPEALEASLVRLRKAKKTREIILTGGEPLILHDEELAPILGALFDVPHIATVRVETRALSLVPQRFDASLCSLLGRFGPLYLQTQFNHPREVSPEATEAAGRLARSGVVLQNGAVLLRTINDSPEVIAALHRTLLKIKVRPAFLIEWTAPPRARHFQADPEAGRRIIDHLRETTSGLAVPTPLAYQRLSE